MPAAPRAALPAIMFPLSSSRCPSRRPLPALDAKFARKVRASRWALLFERLWPRVWLILGLAGLFLLVSLAGLWPHAVGQPLHYVAARRLRPRRRRCAAARRARAFPSHEEAVRRIERVSGVPHRPASSYEDTITANAEDPRTAAIWQAHRARLAAALRRLRVGPRIRAPIARIPSRCAACWCSASSPVRLVGDSVSDRLRSAFRFNSARARLGAARCLGDTAVLHRQAAADAGRRRPAALTPTRRRSSSRCRSAAC